MDAPFPPNAKLAHKKVLKAMRARVHADEKDRFAQHILKTGGVTIPEIGLPEEAIVQGIIDGDETVQRNLTSYWSDGAGGWCPDVVRGCCEALVKMAKADADAKEAIGEVTKLDFTLVIATPPGGGRAAPTIVPSLDGSTLTIAITADFKASNNLPGMPFSKWEKAIMEVF